MGTGRVVVLVLPDVNLLDLGGPVQVFHAAGGRHRLEFVAAEAGEMPSAQGLLLAGLGPLPATAPGDLVLIPGARIRPPTPERPLVPPAVVRWLRAAADGGARIASVCTGAAGSPRWSTSSACAWNSPRACSPRPT